MFFDRRGYSRADWTDWQAPDQVSSDRDLWHKIVHGAAVGKGEASPITVYARFREASFVEFDFELRLSRGRGLPSCPPVAPNPLPR